MSETVRLTHETIEAGMSVMGGWTRSQLALFGVPWPLKQGWKEGLVGKEVPLTTYLQFLAGKNGSKKSRRALREMETPLFEERLRPF